MSAFAINAVHLYGNMTRDPELKSLPSGTSVCDFGIAVNESVKDGQTGEWKDVAHFFNVSMFGKMAEFIARECSKGQAVVIEGKLRSRSWEHEGQRRSAVDVVAYKCIPVARRENTGGAPKASGPSPTAAGGPWDPNAPGSATDDDIPF